MESLKQQTESSKLVSFPGNNQPQSIERVLGYIYDYLHTDLEEKKEEIQELKNNISLLRNEVQMYQQQLEAIKVETENERNQLLGSKQLINKLLEDIKRYQNDIEWYKRTYVKRSLLGTIKEKLFYKK